MIVSGLPMSVSKAFRFKSVHDKNYVTDIVKVVMDRYKELELQGDALKKIALIYEDADKNIGIRNVPTSAEHTIRLANCEFIKYNTITDAFQCYETYHKNRKIIDIGFEHEMVTSACYLCKVGKVKAIQTQVENQLRKKGVSNIYKLLNDLLTIDEKGAIAQIFICQARRLTDDAIIISNDQEHFNCPKLDDKRILIEENCLTAINPTTKQPPCEYLVSPLLKVPIKIPEETQQIIEDIQLLESQKEPNGPKEIDAEYKEVKNE